MKLVKIGSLITAATLLASGMVGCSGSNQSGSADKPATNASAGEKGGGSSDTIQFWGWAPGYKEAVDLWNSEHPDAKVEFTQTENTSKIYPKMFTAINAGNAPCLGQVEYASLPNFVIQDALVNIKDKTADMGKDFTEDGWKSVQIADGVYGIPVDTAPIAFIYRKDILDKWGLKAPTTWEEYRETAKAVKEKDPSVSLGYFSNDANWNAALARQKGAKWFDLGSDSWTVNINDKATKEVADFWQGMINDGLIPVAESYTPALYKQMAEGKILSEPFGIWDTAVLAQSVKDTKGWAVAPMPTWKDRPGEYVSAGGSATAVLKGCKNVDKAIEFAHWMSTDAKAAEKLIKVGGLWPASLTGLDSPVLDEPVEFYGNEKIYEPFKEISKSIKLDWTWGPLQNEVNTDIQNIMPKVDKSNTIADAYDQIQKNAVEAIKAKGMKVK